MQQGIVPLRKPAAVLDHGFYGLPRQGAVNHDNLMMTAALLREVRRWARRPVQTDFIAPAEPCASSDALPAAPRPAKGTPRHDALISRRRVP
jgi:hypothetical protein